MAPRGTPATSSSNPAQSDSHPPGDTPGEGDTGGGGRDVTQTSPLPSPAQSEHSEEREDEREQDDPEEEAGDEGGPGDRSPLRDQEDHPEGKPHKTPVTSFLSLARASVLQSQGYLSSGRAVDSSGQAVAPAVYDVPPEFPSNERIRLVGIPATERHNDGKTYTQNGYGGLEALVQMESLGTGDLARLYDFFGENDDIHDFLLAPRVTPLPADELESVLNSVGVRREMASILTEFGSENLAQRIFGTVSVLQKVVSRYSRVEDQLDASDSATRSAVAAQDELSEIKRAYQFQSEYWTKKVAEVLEEKDVAVRNSREDIQQLVREHSRNKRGLQRQVEKLTSQLDDARAHNRMLEGRLHQSRVEVADVMNFLNDHSQLFLNWPRLRDLLGHFRNGTTVPASWHTMITVVANDDPGFQQIPYVRMQRPRPDEDEETKDSAPPCHVAVDLTQVSTSGSVGGSTKRKRDSSGSQLSKRSSRKVPDSVQEFPSGWDASSDEPCRSDSEPLLLSEQRARELLIDVPIVLDQVRLDVQTMMRSGVKYPGTIEWLSEYRIAHSVFPAEALVEMLVRMMYWNRLDDTFWPRYVPRRYYAIAQAALNDLLEADIHPPYWGPLTPQDDDLVEIDPDEFAPEVDDKAKDGDFVPGEDIPDESEAESPDPDDLAAKRKRRHTSTSSSGSMASLSERRPKSKSGRQSSGTKTALVKKKYAHLTVEKLAVIKTPGEGVASWMHFGVRMKMGDPTKFSEFQTPGFPDYAPNRFDLNLLKERFDPVELQKLLRTLPWRKMFEARPKELFFHKLDDISADGRDDLDEWMGFVCGNSRDFWNILHWFTLGKPSSSMSSLVQKILTKRNKQHETARSKAHQLEKKMEKTLPPTIWNEPGVWKFPNKICYWIPMDKRHFKPGTTQRYSLQEQVDILDAREPSRTQWGICSTDEERIAHLPETARRTLIPAGQRDPVSPFLT